MKASKYFLAIVLTAVTALYTTFGLAACEEVQNIPPDSNPATYAVTYVRGAHDAIGRVPEKNATRQAPKRARSNR